jgi:hypothetical protein
MRNKRGFGERVVVVAAAARTSGQAVVEEGFHGFAETDAAINTRYALDISQTEHEIAFVSGAVKGSVIDILETAPFTLTARARSAALTASSRVFGVVSAVPGNGITNDATVEPKTGFLWVITAPQI